MLHIPTIQLTESCTEEALTHEGEMVLHYASTLPQIHGLSRHPQRHINHYYQHLEQIFQHTCQQKLLPQAAKVAESAHSNALPFTAMETGLTYETTYLDDHLWSVSWTWQVTHGCTPLLLQRQGNVWDLHAGLLCPLPQFFPGKRAPRRFFSQAKKAAAAQNQRGPGHRGRRSSFIISSSELVCFWPTTLNSRRKEDFFYFSVPFSAKERGIC